jgi:plasmid maintenance system antidote protein VapI
MAKKDLNKLSDDNMAIGLEEGKEWTREKLADITAFIKNENAKRTDEQKFATELLALRYKMEDYLENSSLEESQLYTIDRFLDLYLKALRLPFKTFAVSIGTRDSNLKKYLSGDRKFSIDLALKFGYFFHTSPDLWLKVQVKNDMILLGKQAKVLNKYKKYDYKKVLKTTARTKEKVAG